MNWGDLKTGAAKYVHRKDIDWDFAQKLLCADLTLQLDVIENEAVVALAPTASADVPGFYEVATPATYGRVKSILVGKCELMSASETSFWTDDWRREKYAQVGKKLFFARADAAILVYATRVKPMTSDNEESEIAAEYPTAYLYGLIVHALGLIQDYDSLGVHRDTYNSAIGDANANKDMRRFTAGMSPQIVGSR